MARRRFLWSRHCCETVRWGVARSTAGPSGTRMAKKCPSRVPAWTRPPFSSIQCMTMTGRTGFALTSQRGSLAWQFHCRRKKNKA
ncbi:hypothetical protein E2C01_078056 [Portunus trituberculatus]|uniref:Uncharacterized protein n=1 Tax=Portunus trituberculatus TaxID=210409 RepID=A0A5B7IRQ4_PORTR|nr:hypothetical protein [Portunus trituberculatus]